MGQVKLIEMEDFLLEKVKGNALFGKNSNNHCQ